MRSELNIRKHLLKTTLNELNEVELKLDPLMSVDHAGYRIEPHDLAEKYPEHGGHDAEHHAAPAQVQGPGRGEDAGGQEVPHASAAHGADHAVYGALVKF
ncbi:hypothetical protein GWI33_008123 [Rhynchophorus ferrugineus]|uniref:Uncharacterized protein n=1 Tax=Rhynchophorus ferrugineus TaxID=354439 RepID=A0A834IF58_RHYFE|nr:hypothetical protein GWI33_008123 [Rhynchophorus ferrugineus]